MTVADLIKALSAYPPETRVIFDDPDTGWSLEPKIGPNGPWPSKQMGALEGVYIYASYGDRIQ